METDSREFGLFIDGLRLERNMSREDLCDEIISLSQYKRYLRGDASIPNNKLVQIADRLNFSISEIHTMYTHRSDKQYNKINEIYNLIQMHKHTEAYKQLIEYKNTVIVSDYNKLFFDFCMIIVQHNLNMVSDVHVLEIYSEMINYPFSTANQSFNWVELNILIQIIKISAKMENFEPADMLYNLLTTNTLSLNFNRQTNYMPGIYLTLAQILGAQKKYNQVIEITQLGIEFCNKNEVSTALAHLFLVNAYAYFDIGELEKAKTSAKKAFMQLLIENKPNKYEQFKRSFESKFTIQLNEIICI